MLYVLIMYCSGICSSALPPPDSVLFFSKLSDCKAAMAKMPTIERSVVNVDGNKMRNTHFKQTCANMYADSKQLDRILIPEQLAQLVREYTADLKAHPPCVSGWNGKCFQHDPPMASDKCKNGELCVIDESPSWPNPSVAELFGSCRVNEYLNGNGNCVDARTKKELPMCPGPFKGRCTADAHRAVKP